MAVRFHCEKCNNPLEVDDREAGKVVLCFYCKSRTNVPVESSPDLVAKVDGGDVSLTPIVGGAASESSVNRLLIGKAGLAAGIVLIFIILLFYALVFLQVLSVVRADGFKSRPSEEQTQLVSETVQKCVKSSQMLMLGGAALLFAVVGLVLSVIGILQKGKKIAPVAGLIINGGFLIFVVVTVISARYQ